MKHFIYGFISGILSTVILFFALAISSSVHGCDNIQRIKETEVAPCSGWLVKDDTMQQIGKDKKELEVTKQQNITLKELGTTNDQIIDFHKTRAKDLEKSLRWEENKSNLKLIGGFVLGVVISGFTVYSMKQASK